MASCIDPGSMVNDVVRDVLGYGSGSLCGMDHRQRYRCPKKVKMGVEVIPCDANHSLCV